MATKQPTTLEAWALARAIPLDTLQRQARDDNHAVAVRMIAATRARHDRAATRALASNQGPLGRLYQRGLAVALDVQAERKAHSLRVRALRRADMRAGGQWQVQCACGWTSDTFTLRKHADFELVLERAHLDRPLAATISHSIDH